MVSSLTRWACSKHGPRASGERKNDFRHHPDQLFARNANIEAVRAAIAQLPAEFREAVVLREMENYSYKEIADITGVQIGTVMSRLARGRRHLQRILCQSENTSGGIAS